MPATTTGPQTNRTGGLRLLRDASRCLGCLPEHEPAHDTAPFRRSQSCKRYACRERPRCAGAVLSRQGRSHPCRCQGRPAGFCHLRWSTRWGWAFGPIALVSREWRAGGCRGKRNSAQRVPKPDDGRVGVQFSPASRLSCCCARWEERLARQHRRCECLRRTDTGPPASSPYIHAYS